MKICAYIINWNGMRFLPEILPTILEAKSRCDFPLEIVLIDNKSGDGSAAYVQNHFSAKIRVHQALENGWLYSVDECLPIDKPDLFFLLNNDQKLDPEFFKRMVVSFQSSDVAVAGANVMNWGGVSSTLGVVEADFNKVPLSVRMSRQCNLGSATLSRAAVPTVSISGSACAIRGSIYQKLGGFDRLFYPAYFEDTDFCLRVWQAGLQVVFVPQAKAFHFGGGSRLGFWSKRRVEFVLVRSEWLFNLKYQWIFKKSELGKFFLKSAVRYLLGCWAMLAGAAASFFRLGQLNCVDMRAVTLPRLELKPSTIQGEL